MTDKERFKRLMRSFGVTGIAERYNTETGASACIIESHCCANVQGYVGMAAEFDFDKDGNFVCMGVWE